MHTRVHNFDLCIHRCIKGWREEMTIDEAITHAKEVSSRKFDDRVHCIRCAEEHEQLAEWLEELKMYKSLAPRELVSEKQKNDRAMEYSKGFDYGFKTGYAKAIDDLLGGMNQITYNCQDADELFEKICDLAEQLKAGDTDASNGA